MQVRAGDFLQIRVNHLELRLAAIVAARHMPPSRTAWRHFNIVWANFADVYRDVGELVDAVDRYIGREKFSQLTGEAGS